MRIQYLLLPLAVLLLAGNGCREVDLELPGPGRTVTLLEVPDVQAPAYRGTPITAIEAKGQYIGEVAWTPEHRQFFADTEYKAKIILIADYGRTFKGVKENSFIVPGGTASHEANSGTIAVTFPNTGATDDLPVSLTAIPGIQVPASGVVIETGPIDTAQYSGTISWTPGTSRFLGDTEYTAQILLLDKPGWTLMGMGGNGFTVPGAASTVTDSVDPGKITAVFPRTVKTVSAHYIYVDVNVGEVPPTAITETEQYTGTITWTPDDAVFAEKTVYTAEIQLTPKGDWTLTGVWKDCFQVNGATAANEADSGLITAVFPETPATITLSSISGIMAPIAGLEQTEIDGVTSQYDVSGSWIPSGKFFEVSTVYTAEITITPRAGWTLANVPENFFTVSGGTATNAANSNKVTAVYPATADTITGTITLLDIPNITVPVTGEYRNDLGYSTEQYWMTIEWSPYVNGIFEANTAYTAIIRIYPNYGWTVKGLPENAFRVAGAASVTYEVESNRVIAVFPETGD